MSKIIIITLLRKGSKRVRDKNRIKFEGKPLYKHTVEHAKELGYPYYVLTDYSEKEIDIDYGERIEVPTKYCRDHHISNSKIRWFLDKHKIECDFIILLQATSPKRNIKSIKTFIKEFQESGLDCAVACHKIEEGFYYIPQIGIRSYNIENRDYNGAGKNVVIKETGSFYMFRPLMLGRKHITQGSLFFCKDEFNIDIDYWEDINENKNNS